MLVPLVALLLLPIIELADPDKTAATVGAAVVVIMALVLSKPLPFIPDDVDAGIDDGGAITDRSDTDVTADDTFAVAVTTGAVINAFIANLLTIFGSSFKFTDNRFDSNVFMSLLNEAWPLVSLIRKTLCPSKQCMNWWADTQFAHK